ncbi:MAG: sn-glycerol-3-phosphate transport system permease protein UgpA [Firmicutes bacterium]|nr:sn-glycerol-3-phosphate transport system permease protein UgpA [Bacillota bacterium]
MERRVIFNNKVLPYVLLAPQLAIILVFFIWPAMQAISQSMLMQDPFGLRTEFVMFDNFITVLSSRHYLASVRTTIVFSLAVTFASMSVGLFLAVMADKQIRGATIYKSLLLWPYAVAPAVAAVLWLFIFHPSIGFIGLRLREAGIAWDYKLQGNHALLLVIVAASWKQVSYNFLFFLAALQSVPKPLLDAAAIDGASSVRRFWSIVFPLISPTTFFLLMMNMIYALFDTFGVIHTLTGGGPSKATETLMYKAYLDGVVNLNLGTSSAQSVILMLIVFMLTALQFRFVERRVHY